MIPTKNTKHVTEARELIIDQFRGRRVIQGILDAVVGETQALEDATFDVIMKRLLTDATDAQLDSLGDLVGEPRLARDDDPYRAAILLRIRVNRSQGKAEDIIQTAAIYTDNDFAYVEIYPAGFYVSAFDIEAAAIFRRMLGQAKAAGTRGVLVSSDWSADENFVYGSVYGTVSNAKGFGSVYTSDIVSKFTSAQEMKP